MRRILFLAMLLVLFCDCSYAHLFKRALVVEGMNLNSAISVGIYDGMTDADKKPDVVISSCGASIANGVLNAFPDRDKRMKYLLSREYYSLLKGVTQRDPNLLTAASNLVEGVVEMKLRRLAMMVGQDTIPELFKGYLLDVDVNDAGPFEKHFSENDAVRSVLLGAKLHFDPKDVGAKRGHRPLYQETYFTDSVIAAKLAGFLSPVAKAFPDSAIDSATATITDHPVSDAMRVSISDPYLMAPVKLGDQYFLAGTVDLYPLEVANLLADEVAAVYPTHFSFIEQSAVSSSFEDAPNVRLRQYTDSYVRYWVDASDFSEIDKDQFGIFQIGLSWNPTKETLALKVPDNFSDFQAKVKKQWYEGYKRGLEAAHQAPNSKAHIRGINSENTSESTRAEIKAETSNQDFTLALPQWAAEIFDSIADKEIAVRPSTKANLKFASFEVKSRR